MCKVHRERRLGAAKIIVSNPVETVTHLCIASSWSFKSPRATGRTMTIVKFTFTSTMGGIQKSLIYHLYDLHYHSFLQNALGPPRSVIRNARILPNPSIHPGPPPRPQARPTISSALPLSSHPSFTPAQPPLLKHALSSIHVTAARPFVLRLLFFDRCTALHAPHVPSIHPPVHDRLPRSSDLGPRLSPRNNLHDAQCRPSLTRPSWYRSTWCLRWRAAPKRYMMSRFVDYVQP